MKKNILTIALCACALCARAGLYGFEYNAYTTNTPANLPGGAAGAGYQPASAVLTSYSTTPTNSVVRTNDTTWFDAKGAAAAAAAPKQTTNAALNVLIAGSANGLTNLPVIAGGLGCTVTPSTNANGQVTYTITVP